MAEDPKPTAERIYQIGDVGPSARVAQGEHISWIEGMTARPDGESLARQFTELLKRIDQDASLDDDTRALAQDKCSEASRTRNAILSAPVPPRAGTAPSFEESIWAQQKEATRRRAQGATLQELADSYDRSISTMRRATRAAI